jgi:hypothetical protein
LAPNTRIPPNRTVLSGTLSIRRFVRSTSISGATPSR